MTPFLVRSVLPEEDGGADVTLSLQWFPLPQVVSYLFWKHTCSTDIKLYLTRVSGLIHHHKRGPITWQNFTPAEYQYEDETSVSQFLNGPKVDFKSFFCVFS